jgi:hypothetical protein
MATRINYEDIPNVTIENYHLKEYCSECDTFWRKEIDSEKRIELQKSNTLYYYSIELFIGRPFYFESTKTQVSREEALRIFLDEMEYYQSYDELEDLIYEAIDCKSYITPNMRSGWYYFNQEF